MSDEIKAMLTQFTVKRVYTLLCPDRSRITVAVFGRKSPDSDYKKLGRREFPGSLIGDIHRLLDDSDFVIDNYSNVEGFKSFEWIKWSPTND